MQCYSKSMQIIGICLLIIPKMLSIYLKVVFFFQRPISHVKHFFHSCRHKYRVHRVFQKTYKMSTSVNMPMCLGEVSQGLAHRQKAIDNGGLLKCGKTLPSRDESPYMQSNATWSALNTYTY